MHSEKVSVCGVLRPSLSLDCVSWKGKCKWIPNLFRDRITLPWYAEEFRKPETSTVWKFWKYNFNTGWCTSSHWSSCKTIAKTTFHIIFQRQGLLVCLISKPRDFWFWDFLKYNIYRQRSSSVPNVKDSIWCRIFDIPAGSLLSLFKVWFYDWRTLLIMMRNILCRFNATLLFNIHKVYWMFL